MRILASVLALQAHILLVAAADPLVDLGYATYAGSALPNGVNEFLGMRYAAPPTGERRFRRAESPLQETGLVQAKSVSIELQRTFYFASFDLSGDSFEQHGPICLSVEGLASGEAPLPASEDCLFIDVYTPANASNISFDGLPVMLWIQGGAFVELINPNYNGSGLIEASEGSAIIVSFNYRVGPYGFLASGELQQEGNLNIGLQDQRAAISWVQQYIRQFGGDPDRVTIFGTSIGGGSVLMQTLAYGGQSSPDNAQWSAGIGASVYIPSVFQVQDLEFQYDQLLNATNCIDLACLRSLKSDAIQAANIARPNLGHSEVPLFPAWPVIDGEMFTDQPLEMLRAGNFSKDRPLIIGSSATEGTIFAPQANTTEDVNSFLRTQFPDLTDEDLEKANALYSSVTQTFEGVTTKESPLYTRVAKMFGDVAFNCPAFAASQLLTEAGTPVHSFRTHILDDAEVAAGFIVPHTWELQAVWGPEYSTSYVALPNANSYDINRSNRAAVTEVQSYWLSFAMAADPNLLREVNSPAWNSFSNGTRLVLQTNSTHMENILQEEIERCAFWDSIFARTHI